MAVYVQIQKANTKVIITNHEFHAITSNVLKALMRLVLVLLLIGWKTGQCEIFKPITINYAIAKLNSNLT